MDEFKTEILTDDNVKEIQTILSQKFEITIDLYGNRSELNVGKEELDYLIYLLEEIRIRLNKDVTIELLEFLKELFKSLRNCMVGDENRQNYFVNKPKTLQNVKSILLMLIKRTDCKKSVLCVKMIFQFLINLVVGNESTALKLWEIFSDIYNILCQKCDSYYTCALLYNILIKCPKLPLEQEIYETVLNFFQLGIENEYVIFLIELFLKFDHFCDIFTKLKLDHRIILLEVIKHRLLLNEKTDSKFELPQSQVQTFSSEFKRKSDCILKTVTDYIKNIDIREVVLLLEVLASLSSHEKYLSYLQNDKSLLINSVFLLKSIHEAGKQGHKEFAPIQKLSQINNSESNECNSPAFGFKVDLIRIISNLCWKHKINQDSVRDMDGIPIILDCCNIDAKNPFIIQWVILAVRNLCDNNLENQKIIESMKKEGYVDTAVLKEIGFTLNSDQNSSLKIVSLEDLKKRMQ